LKYCFDIYHVTSNGQLNKALCIARYLGVEKKLRSLTREASINYLKKLCFDAIKKCRVVIKQKTELNTYKYIVFLPVEAGEDEPSGAVQFVFHTKPKHLVDQGNAGKKVADKIPYDKLYLIMVYPISRKKLNGDPIIAKDPDILYINYQKSLEYINPKDQPLAKVNYPL